MKTSNLHLKKVVSLCMTGCLLTVGFGLNAQNSEKKDGSKKKVYKNQIEIGYTGGYYFDGEGYKMSQSSVQGNYTNPTTTNRFSLSYKRELKNENRILGLKVSGLKYSESFSGSRSKWIRQEYITSVGSISYGKYFTAKRKKNLEFRSYYTFDLSYRTGTENGGSVSWVYSDAPQSGYWNPGVNYNSPGLGASLGADLILFKRVSLGTECSYSHFFFQKGYFEYWGDEQPNRDLFIQHFKIGWLF